jgi:hypothetical protein
MIDKYGKVCKLQQYQEESLKDRGIGDRQPQPIGILKSMVGEVFHGIGMQGKNYLEYDWNSSTFNYNANVFFPLYGY